MDDRRLAALKDEPLDASFRGFPAQARLRARDAATQGWSLRRGDVPLPLATLRARALEHNVQTMAQLCRDRGVDLAPHGKTTMAPELFARQLDAGAWAITAATASHVALYREFGVPRIFVANQLVEPASIRWLFEQLASDPGFEAFLLADSIDVVERLVAQAEYLGDRTVPVLVELGVEGGRMGARTVDQAHRVGAAIRATRFLDLAGVEAFEGIMHSGSLDGDLTAIDRFLGDLCALARRLDDDGMFERDEVLVSAGGSGYFDRVLDATAGLALSRPTRIVLRSGCYITHDHGYYAGLQASERVPLPRPFEPALEVWAPVLSCPEPGLAIAGLGKRDVGTDIGPPILLAAYRGGDNVCLGRVSVTDLNDQHAYIHLDRRVEVGDILRFGISHPCTTLDKWRRLAVIDDDDVVVDTVRTFF